jgi:pimeloyl-ACP methyl ester carboxylesterase
MNDLRPIVTVHGLWNRGPEAWMLRRRLRHLTGRPIVQFRYPSVSGDFADNAGRLAGMLERDRGPTDLVGHSLGGLLVLEAIRWADPAAVGRVVLLAAPVRGSAAARRLLARSRGGGRIIGRSASVLAGGVDLSVPEGLEVGMIAGSGAKGMGRILGAMTGVHDGTVGLDETRFEGLADHIVLPVTHTGMLFSDAVARAVAEFLRDGRFGR